MASSDKIGPDLAELLRDADPAEPIEVILELERTPAGGVIGSRAERVAMLQRSFDETLAQVVQHMGPTGQVLDKAWINSTVRARIAASQIETLESEDQVLRIDSPRALRAD